jgi:hypothetical protein
VKKSLKLRTHDSVRPGMHLTQFRLFLLLAGVISIGVAPLHAGIIFQFTNWATSNIASTETLT